jgi:hypothetical protein
MNEVVQEKSEAEVYSLKDFALLGKIEVSVLGWL